MASRKGGIVQDASIGHGRDYVVPLSTWNPPGAIVANRILSVKNSFQRLLDNDFVKNSQNRHLQRGK